MNFEGVEGRGGIFPILSVGWGLFKLKREKEYLEKKEKPE